MGNVGSGTGVRLSSFSTNSYTDYTISLDTWYYFDVEIDIDQRLVIGHIYNSSGTLLTTQQ